MVVLLSENLILELRKDQINLYSGAYGVRDANMLDSALNMPKAQFGREFLHHSIEIEV